MMDEWFSNIKSARFVHEKEAEDHTPHALLLYPTDSQLNSVTYTDLAQPTTKKQLNKRRKKKVRATEGIT